jgi:hypothetical protein
MIMMMIYTRRYEKEEDIKDAYIKSSSTEEREERKTKRGRVVPLFIFLP